MSIFNSVNSTIPYTLPVKFTKVALELEAAGRNATHIWETLSVMLEKAQEKGITYLSLGRGWDGKQDIAGGKKILDLMSQNLQATRNDPLKSKIFNMLLDEADKKEQGLFAIPDTYKKYPTVMKAYAEYEALVEDSKFVVLGVQFNTLEVQEQENLPELNSNDEEAGATSVESDILGMPVNQMSTLTDWFTQILGGNADPKGRTATDFFTQAMNLVDASDGNLEGLANIAPDIINNPQNTNSQLNVQSEANTDLPTRAQNLAATVGYNIETLFDIAPHITRNLSDSDANELIGVACDIAKLL